jgi:hypothetical protein
VDDDQGERAHSLQQGKVFPVPRIQSRPDCAGAESNETIVDKPRQFVFDIWPKAYDSREEIACIFPFSVTRSDDTPHSFKGANERFDVPFTCGRANPCQKFLSDNRTEINARGFFFVEFSNQGQVFRGTDKVDIDVGIDEVLCHLKNFLHTAFPGDFFQRLDDLFAENDEI